MIRTAACRNAQDLGKCLEGICSTQPLIAQDDFKWALISGNWLLINSSSYSKLNKVPPAV